MMKKLTGISLASVLLLPALALAQQSSNAGLLGTLALAGKFLNGVIGLMVTLAIVIFFWGLIQYLVNVGEEKSKGLQIMFYGVVAIFVMVSLWGIVRMFQITFGVTNNSSLSVPTVQYQY